MHNKKNKFNFESEEIKTKYINEIIGFFHDERSEDIGYIAAEKVLDFVMQSMGEEIYKKAINDCKKILKERNDELEIELELLLPNSTPS